MVKIQIKRNNKNTAILISFSTQSDKFESMSERTKFFEELYGRNQTIKRGGKVYKYRRKGVMENINKINVDNSVFIIMEEHMKRMEEFFNEWEDKVMFKTFPVLLDEEEAEQLEEKEPENNGFKLLKVSKKKMV